MLHAQRSGALDANGRERGERDHDVRAVARRSLMESIEFYPVNTEHPPASSMHF